MKIENEFISYTLAKELKQRGYKENCLGVWRSVEVPTPFLTVGREYSVDDMQGGYFTLAPLYSSVFTFFREKYNLEGIVSTDVWHSKKCSWRICGGIPYEISPNESDNLYDWESETVFETYKQAQEDCIKQLLKIVKL